MSRRLFPFVLLASLGSAAPAAAQQFAFARDGMVGELEQQRWTGDYIGPGQEFTLGTLTTAGGTTFSLSKTTLPDFAKTFGGAIQRFENAGYDTQWLCYTASGVRIWYFSGGAPEEMNGGYVDWVLMEEAEPTYDGDYGCSSQPRAMLVPGGKVPALGASRDDVAKLYEVAVPADQPYVTIFQQDDAEPYAVTNVTLHFEGDRLTGMSLVEGEESP